jgi:hypothetical protein
MPGPAAVVPQYPAPTPYPQAQGASPPTQPTAAGYGPTPAAGYAPTPAAGYAPTPAAGYAPYPAVGDDDPSFDGAGSPQMRQPAPTPAAYGMQSDQYATITSITSSAIETSTSTTTTTVTTTHIPTLYCWALMLPHGYERGLMKHLLAKNQSIFRCDSFQVFSEGEQEVGPGPPRVVAEDIGSTKVGWGGPYHNALNSEVFERAWRRVFAASEYLYRDWTVKVDPDTVFLANRLRTHLHKSDPKSIVYLNDCDQGLHGPIEVVSNGGMLKFANGMKKCVAKLRKEWDWAGEDVFLRHCFGVLEINRVDDFKLLSEQVCMWQDPVNKGCITDHVAFHPFKTEDTYFKCLKQAQAKGR